MNLVQELLQEFCQNWQGYNVLKYEGYLQRTNNASERIELLALMMQKEIQFVFEPPAHVKPSSEDQDEDDDCVRPNLRLLLAHFPELNDHPKKILDLVLFEFAMCLRFDDLPPTPENYLDLVPQDHRSHLCETLERIESILQKPKNEPEVEVHASDLTVKDPLGSANVSLNRLPCILGNYLVLSVIDRGGMGTVYSAVDLRTAAPVAIKVMKRDDAWSIYRFIHEFTWLSQMIHPNLVKLFDTCAEGEYRYFSMEVVEGLTLSKWFQSVQHKPDPYMRLKKVLQQVASALQFLHRRGGLHCDIKCSNVMITSKRRAVLLDLGLAVQEHSGEKGLGTIQYSAPEVIKTEVHSRASDWFSFGLMIYEAIVGEYNLRTEQAKSGSRDPDLYVIDSKDLRAQLEGADQGLIDLCCDLTQTDPAARPSGTEVVERLGGSPDPVLTYGSFIGRKDLLRGLDAIEQKDAAHIVILGGESGIGKTSLIQEWLRRRSRSDNDLVLKLRCFRQDQTPLRVLNGLIQDLMQVLPKIPESIWLPSLKLHVDSISRTFPQIRQLIETSNDFRSRHPSSKTHSTENENLSTLHLMQWIAQLAQELRFLLVIDDAQWSDQRSLAWIVELFQQRGFSGKALILDESLPADGEEFGQVLQTISDHIFVSNPSPAEVLNVPGLSIELL
ncbi:MAG: serine/threonine-protein kinase, partial [Planctomycetota bacterium]